MKRFRAHIAFAVAATAIATPAVAGGLNLTIDGIRSAKGSVLALVFDDATAFDQLDWYSAVQYADIPAQAGRVSHRFPDLEGGPFAVFVFHDENGDQDLNISGKRVLEGIGATGATTSTPYPTFSQAAVTPGDVTVHIYYDQ